MRAATAALAAFKVAIGSGGAALAGLKNVRVHSQAHGAAGLAPVKAGFDEDLVEAFGFSLRLDGLRAGNHHGADVRGDFVAGGDAGGGAEIFNAGVCTGANEDAVN